MKERIILIVCTFVAAICFILSGVSLLYILNWSILTTSIVSVCLAVAGVFFLSAAFTSYSIIIEERVYHELDMINDYPACN